MRSSIPPHREITRDLCLHYVEIPKVDFSAYDFTLLEKWLYYIKRADDVEDPMIEKIRSEVPEIDEAAKERERILANAREMAAAIRQEKWERDQVSYRKAALRIGREEGRALGLAEGKAEGKVEGKAEGKAERSRELALKLKTEGFSLEKISELTDLTLEEVEAL